ncbi:MAG: hypothetical protein HYT83_03330 [Candidatus Levybacteria bacterium]|nr:hypothetical protein [Candidatus Levybacteria bacterium]
MELQGYLAALGAVLVWGSYSVPFKKSPASNPVQFQALMGVGVFLFALFISLILKYSLNLNYYGLIAGILWGVANAISLSAIRAIGIARAIPIWVSVIVVVTFLSGAFIFNDLPSGVLVGLVGMLGIIGGVLLIGSAGDARGENLKKGILLSILAGTIFGICITPIKIGNLQPSMFFFPMSVGILLFSLGFGVFKKLAFKNEAIFQGIAGGVLWNVGNLFSIIAISFLGLAKGYPITQAALLISVFWGVFYFKEVTKRSDLVKILSGAIILVAGVVILGLA